MECDPAAGTACDGLPKQQGTFVRKLRIWPWSRKKPEVIHVFWYFILEADRNVLCWRFQKYDHEWFEFNWTDRLYKYYKVTYA